MSAATLSAPARWTVRQHRPALLVWTGLVLAGIGGLLWLAGPLMDQARRGTRQLEQCRAGETCMIDIGHYHDVDKLLTAFMILLPLVVAAWAGAALTARELESETALMAWTQGVTPVRWLAVRLALPAVAVTVGTGLLITLHRYAWRRSEGGIGTYQPWWQALPFHVNGPTLVTVCLAALGVGALTGLLVRRTLPSLGISVAATGLLFAGAHWLMPYLWPTVTKETSLGHVYVGLYSGVEVRHGLVTRAGAHVPLPDCTADAATDCERFYERHGGVGFFSDYHPASPYWPLQLTTSAVLLLVTALVTAASFMVLRRRTG